MLIAHIIFPESRAMFLYPLLIGAVGIVGSHHRAAASCTIDEPAQGQQPAVMRAMYTGLGDRDRASCSALLVRRATC